MASPDIQRLSSRSIDDLYEELGRSLVSGEYARTPTISREVAVQRGRAFLSGNSDKLNAKICVEWRYCSKRADYGTFQSLVYAVAPLVSSVVGVPAATALIVAIILVKVGLDDLCKCPNA
jgi:hypothetical protein